MAEKVYSVKGVADLLGVTRVTVRNYINRGVLKPDSIHKFSNYHGFRYEFKQSTVDAFIQSCSKVSVPCTKLLSTGDVGRILDVTASAIQYYVNIGKLVPDVRLPKRTNGRVGVAYFSHETVMNFLEENKDTLRRGEEWIRLMQQECLRSVK